MDVHTVSGGIYTLFYLERMIKMKTIMINKANITEDDTNFIRKSNTSPVEIRFKTKKEIYVFPADIAGDSLYFENAILKILAEDPAAFDDNSQIAHLRQSDIIPQVNTDIIVSILFEYNVNFNSLLPAGLTEIDLSNPPDVDEIVRSQLSKSFENEYNKIKATAKIVSVGNNKLMHFDEPCAYVSPYTHEVIYETDTTAYLFPADIAGDSNLFLEALSNILRSNPSAFNCFPEAKKLSKHQTYPLVKI